MFLNVIVFLYHFFPIPIHGDIPKIFLSFFGKSFFPKTLEKIWRELSKNYYALNECYRGEVRRRNVNLILIVGDENDKKKRKHVDTFFFPFYLTFFLLRPLVPTIFLSAFCNAPKDYDTLHFPPILRYRLYPFLTIYFIFDW